MADSILHIHRWGIAALCREKEVLYDSNGNSKERLGRWYMTLEDGTKHAVSERFAVALRDEVHGRVVEIAKPVSLSLVLDPLPGCTVEEARRG